jgi:hypothetical protein
MARATCTRTIGWLLVLWAFWLTSGAVAQDEPEAEGASSASESREARRERRRKRHEERDRLKAERAAADAAKARPVRIPDDPGALMKRTPTDVTQPAPASVVAQVEDAAAPVPLYDTHAVLSGEGPLDPIKLPPSYRLELMAGSPEQLRRLDGRLSQTVDVMQAGERCEALRGASRVPFRTWMWREHRRELSIAAGLFVLALVCAFAWPSPAMRAIAPLIPLLGCVYVGWDGSSRASSVMDGITRGLRACSTALDEGDPSKPQIVRGHVEQVARMSASIDAAYEQDDQVIKRLMDDYRM